MLIIMCSYVVHFMSNVIKDLKLLVLFIEHDLLRYLAH